jgi:putative restriction endonuclease
MDTDLKIRLSAFQWLETQYTVHEDVLPRTLLEEGFVFEGQRIPLVSPAGIFKPRLCKYPISITSTLFGGYDDKVEKDGYLDYKYRRTGPTHRDNVGLRELMKNHIPLIYFYGIARSKYSALWPTYIIYDDREHFTFKAYVDDKSVFYKAPDTSSMIASDIDSESRRRYITTAVKIRLHQQLFREKVLSAYRNRCSFCQLKHQELLDAAHILPDSDPEGHPVVNNGLALCKLHHAAFDKYFIGIRPDFVIQIREDIRNETDGPMLQHGLQQLHDRKIDLPHLKTNWPNPIYLEKRYDIFKNVV